MGTDTMEAALERVNRRTLADAMSHPTQPLLIVHATGIPVTEAGAAFAAAAWKDKTLLVFTIEEGGSEHVNADDRDPAWQLIADWFCAAPWSQATSHKK
jgi:alpha-beta hydrolase superfamily lysophospholipase